MSTLFPHEMKKEQSWIGWVAAVSIGFAGCQKVESFVVPELQAIDAIFVAAGQPHDGNPCDWSGITCNEKGRIVELSLSDIHQPQFQQVLDEKLETLVHLTKLEIVRSELRYLPTSIDKLTALEVLVLSQNRLTVLPEELTRLTHLKSLRLWDNQLTELPRGFGNLTQLQALNITNNQIKKLPDDFGNLTNLSCLYLGGNQLEELPSGFGNLTNLVVLYLFQNNIKIWPQDIGNLIELKELDLFDNKLSGSIPIWFSQLTHLSFLDVSENYLDERMLPEGIGSSCYTLLFIYGPQKELPVILPSDV